MMDRLAPDDKIATDRNMDDMCEEEQRPVYGTPVQVVNDPTTNGLLSGLGFARMHYHKRKHRFVGR